MTKYIFITGNIFAFRKSIFTSSIAALLEEDNLKINIKKITENKLNKTFVTSDGEQLDIDLGFYERFTNIKTNKSNNLILNNNYNIYDLINFIELKSELYDIILIEVNNININIIEYFINKYCKHNIINIHFLLINNLIDNKIKPDIIINNYDCNQFIDSNIYKIPYLLYLLNYKKKIFKLLDIKYNGIIEWQKIYFNIEKLNEIIYIYVIIKFNDSYISLKESLKHACYYFNKNIKIIWIDPNKITKEDLFNKLKEYKGGIIVPGGFGDIGFENKINAITFARENNISFLGICYGMQIMIIEYARNILCINNASTQEIDKKNNLIHIVNLIENKKARLGDYIGKIDKKSLLYNQYNNYFYIERYRHKYKINNKYINDFEKQGLIFTGKSLDNKIMEIAEVPNKNFFVGVQFHPELNSKINKPNPVLIGFIKSLLI